MASYEGTYVVQYAANCGTAVQIYFAPTNPDQEDCYNEDACSVSNSTLLSSTLSATATATSTATIPLITSASVTTKSLNGTASATTLTASATSTNSPVPFPTISTKVQAALSGNQKVNYCARYPYSPVDHVEVGLGLLQSGFLYSYDCHDPLNRDMQMMRVNTCMANWDKNTNSTKSLLLRTTIDPVTKLNVSEYLPTYVYVTATQSSANFFYYTDRLCQNPAKSYGLDSVSYDLDNGCSARNVTYSIVRDAVTIPDNQILSCTALVNGSLFTTVPNTKAPSTTRKSQPTGSASISMSVSASITTSTPSGIVKGSTLDVVVIIGVTVGVFVIALGLVAYLLHRRRNQMSPRQENQARSVFSHDTVEPFTVLKATPAIEKNDPFLNILGIVPTAAALNDKKDKKDEVFEELPHTGMPALDLPDDPRLWTVEEAAKFVTFHELGITGVLLLAIDVEILVKHDLTPNALGRYISLRDALVELKNSKALEEAPKDEFEE
ncbi:UNVERIFIED_CONTAM: hypothetical protein HDU68_001704 [Siphonaria sp. JEL0065]|nr:hypothetical protein HDU68_001704 [Siphonaria sp. JEL0065]